VLDEADRMVDMGFAPDLKRILRLLPRERQTMMFSATMPPALNDVAREALVDPVRVDLAPPSKPAAGITQAVYPVPRALKTDLLDELLQRTDMSGVIVFTRTKRGRVQVLVATDIASRGIDVEDLTHVINFDVPMAPEDYVHRIGRTGRADATGDAFTLMSPEEERDVKAIERFIGKSILRVTVPDFDYKKHPTPHGDGSHGHGHGKGHGEHSRGRGPNETRPAARQAPATPSEPSHGRRPRREAPGTGRRRM